jgi:putative flavoprotein involved in K+ transport
MDELLDVIVIGAGHAGLSISKLLCDLQLKHLVFERNQIGESWRSQRWDSFKLNSTNRINVLPKQAVFFKNPDAFCSAIDFVSCLEAYSKSFNLPVIEHSNVTGVEKKSGDKNFTVHVSTNNPKKIYRSKQIVVASGGQNEIYIPSFANKIRNNILQFHASEYKNAAALPKGNVLVIGSAQSGIQIAEDLADAGKHVFLSTSKVGRIPRQYRGKDILEWLIDIGFYDALREEITDPQILKLRQPQVSGVGERGHTCSLQFLAKKGVIILGKVKGVGTDTIFLQPNAADHIKSGDEFSIRAKAWIDEYIKKHHLIFPQAEEDMADTPDDEGLCASSITELNITNNNITSIIWTTGFTGNFNYLKLPVFNNDKTLKHRDGISDIEGLYFLGLPWLRKRKSGIIWGIVEDANFIAEQVNKFANRK